MFSYPSLPAEIPRAITSRSIPPSSNACMSRTRCTSLAENRPSPCSTRIPKLLSSRTRCTEEPERSASSPSDRPTDQAYCRSSRRGPSDRGRQDPSRPTVLQRRQITGDDQHANLRLAVAEQLGHLCDRVPLRSQRHRLRHGYVPPVSSAGWRVRGSASP